MISQVFLEFKYLEFLIKMLVQNKITSVQIVWEQTPKVVSKKLMHNFALLICPPTLLKCTYLMSGEW